MTSHVEIVRRSGPELAAAELEAILALRAAVFVVEQACPYQDVDGLDLLGATTHLWIDGADGRPAAYLRLLDDGDVRRIGRVVTAPSHRGAGLAAALMDEAVALAARPVVLAAQSQLTSWYERWAFTIDGPEFLDDGIPHTPMRRI